VRRKHFQPQAPKPPPPFGRQAVQHERNFPNGSESFVMSMSDQQPRPVVVAMIAICVMEPSVDQVIDMITVRDGFVSAVRTMLVA
jgi:hypothetical protein